MSLIDQIERFLAQNTAASVAIAIAATIICIRILLSKRPVEQRLVTIGPDMCIVAITIFASSMVDPTSTFRSQTDAQSALAGLVARGIVIAVLCALCAKWAERADSSDSWRALAAGSRAKWTAFLIGSWISGYFTIVYARSLA